MSDNHTPPPSATATVRRHHFSSVWLIPIIAALIAGYLGLRSYAEHGPIITISFRTADGLSTGQTTVRYKSVTLGTVDNITLNGDHSGVIVRIRMNAGADEILTDQARFWIERPRLTTTSLSDIVSGTYIEVDPGEKEGLPKSEFVGLENQPSLPADGPGTTYVLSAHRLGSVTEGSPVFFRDINVGKVLGYDLGDGFGPITVKVFVRKPYDRLVRPVTHFWNASGLSIKIASGGLHIEMQSLQSVLAGGIAFDTPVTGKDQRQADPQKAFTLYDDHKLAELSSFSKRIPCVTYVQSSVSDLAPGSPVQLFGMEVGEVTAVALQVTEDNQARVRIAFDIEPERAFGAETSAAPTEAVPTMRRLVQSGMRVKVESSELIAGQEILSLEFSPATTSATVGTEGDTIVLPGAAGGIDTVADTVADIANKLNQIPFEEIGRNLNQLVGGPEMHQAIHSLAVTMANAQDLSIKVNRQMTPALQRLPAISEQLQSAVTQANSFLGSVDGTYGADSDFQRSTKRVLDQANDAARAIRLLADYLERHPEALLQGKSTSEAPP
jgi:paraquat-inducible protein B